MTAPAIALNPSEFQFARPDPAISLDARNLRELQGAALEVQDSVALGKTLWDFELACWEAAQPNWDGYGARAIDRTTYLTAKQFLEAVPRTSIEPDISIDPDGEVSFSWRREPRQVFSVSIGGNGRLSYAGIFGAVNTHGTEYFIEQIPQTILAGLTRVLPPGR
jgi:hypothetical protein